MRLSTLENTMIIGLLIVYDKTCSSPATLSRMPPPHMTLHTWLLARFLPSSRRSTLAGSSPLEAAATVLVVEWTTARRAWKLANSTLKT